MTTVFPRPSNPPEQPALGYRIGARADFLRWMLGQLRWQEIPDGPNAAARPLAGLATHSVRDPTVALLDAFAVTADVLTFYQERIANEGFLRTATETRSVMEMGRALGYALGPGLAASTWLAFTVETAVGAPPEVVIDVGVRVLSIPGQDQRPQTFETVERIVARPEWNQLQPMTSVPQGFTPDAADLWVALSQASLSPGDALLFVSNDRETDTSKPWEVRTVTGVTSYPASGSAQVALTPPASNLAPLANGGLVYLMNQRAGVFGNNAPDWKAMPASVQHQFYTGGGTLPTEWPNFDVTLDANNRLLLDNLYPRLLPQTWMLLVAEDNTKLYWADSLQTVGHADFTLTARSTAPALLDKRGGGTPDITAFTSKRRGIVVLGQGDNLKLVDRPLVNATWGTAILAPFPNVITPTPQNPVDLEDQIALEGLVRGLTAGRTLVVSGKRLRARVQLAAGVTLTAMDGLTVSYPQGEVLFVVSRPLPTGSQWIWHLADAGGFDGTVTLNTNDVILEPADKSDPLIAEVATLKAVLETPDRTTLVFQAALKYWYDRATTTLAGNVAVATNGETVNEALGSGDGSQTNQSFTLRRTPLTWVSAATPSGRQSSLEIRVDGVLWHEVTSFHDQSANSRVYLVQNDENGRTTVVFGDGIHGARLNSGLENVVAKYRIGTGLDGEVDAGKIMLFQTRPLGLRAVQNPLPATGAQAPDTGATAKIDIPESVLTLDRVVSLTDYETFAQTFAGIGKARARYVLRGQVQRVHLTLALADGSPAPADAVILVDLAAALDAVRDTTTPVEMAGNGRVWFRVAAQLQVGADYLFADVAAAASAAMMAAFSFGQRAFAQNVSAAEVVALLQGVPGMTAVDLVGLALFHNLSDQTIPSQVSAPLLVAQDTASDGSVPAELLLLDPSPLGLTFTNPEVQS